MGMTGAAYDLHIIEIGDAPLHVVTVPLTPGAGEAFYKFRKPGAALYSQRGTVCDTERLKLWQLLLQHAQDGDAANVDGGLGDDAFAGQIAVAGAGGLGAEGGPRHATGGHGA